MESPSLILFRLRFSSFKPRQSPWIVTRCTCLESFAGCCPGCLGRPNSPNCELKSKWYVCEDFHLVWSVIKSSEHLHWSFDLILISFPPRIWLWTMLHLQGYHASRHVPTHPTESAGRTGMQCPASMTNWVKAKRRTLRWPHIKRSQVAAHKVMGLSSKLVAA